MRALSRQAALFPDAPIDREGLRQLVEAAQPTLGLFRSGDDAYAISNSADGPERQMCIAYAEPTKGTAPGEAPADPLDAGVRCVELTGHQEVVDAVVRAFTDQGLGDVDASPLPEPEPLLAARVEEVAADPSRALQVAFTRSRLQATPWVLQELRRAYASNRPLLVRTSYFTKASPAIRRFIRSGQLIWVREDIAGPTEGLTGRPFDWRRLSAAEDAKRVALPDGDTVTLRVQIAHTDNPPKIGATVETLAAALGGPARYGYAEPATMTATRDAIRRSYEHAPQRTVFAIDHEAFAGTLTVRVGDNGVMEDLDVELLADPGATRIFDAVQPLVPLYFLHDTHIAPPDAILHVDVARRMGETLPHIIGGSYVSIYPPKSSGPLVRRMLEDGR